MTAKSKAQLMRETRARRKKAGLVDYRRPVTEAEKAKLDELLDKMRKK